MNWKDKLLSSGLPLEYDAAKILVQNDFCIDFDYSYTRLDNQNEKEFSVDLLASRWNPFGIPLNSDIKLNLDVLVECKYRNPSVNWLFIPEINSSGFENYSEFGWIKIFDQFSNIFYRNKWACKLHPEICLKGVEVNIKTGDCHDTGIRHGVFQLLYALPDLISENIFSCLRGKISDAKTFIICPILLTTAKLRIINDAFSIDKLQSAKDLDDISKIVPYVIFHSDTVPSFDDHCSNVFENFRFEKYLDRINHFEKLRIQNNINFPYVFSQNSSPQNLLKDLKNGINDGIFDQTFVCTIDSFQDLLDHIKSEILLLVDDYKLLNQPSK